MAPFDYAEHPHRRFNPLSGRWILVSPHRAKRPWQGAVEELPKDERLEYDPKDFLGPGNTRVNGTKTNPKYEHTYVFDNDFMALLPDTPDGAVGECGSDLLVARAVKGRCRVVCFHPALNRTIAEMNVKDIRHVIDAWCSEYAELAKMPYVDHVQIFENKGAMMGCSNPHPHGQIWASGFVPDEPRVALENLEKYHKEKGTHMLEDYAALESREKIRIVCENDSFLAVVPFWAAWPFEVMVFSRVRVPSLLNFDNKLKDDLADIYRRVTCRYDNLFNTLFPYSMGIHQAPVNMERPDLCPYSHFRMFFYPPLLRSATVRKFMVGFEMLGEPQRDLTAEQAAARLQKRAEVHYSQNDK